VFAEAYRFLGRGAHGCDPVAHLVRAGDHALV
jgi:hypothetical protein